MLCDFRALSRFNFFRPIEGHGDSVHAPNVAVFGLEMLAVGIIGGDDEKGVVEPRHLRSGLEEIPQGAIDIVDGFLEARPEITLLGQHETLGHFVRIARRKRVDGRGERLMDAVEGVGGILQERSVINAPLPVKVAVVVVFDAPEIVLESGAAREFVGQRRRSRFRRRATSRSRFPSWPECWPKWKAAPQGFGGCSTCR